MKRLLLSASIIVSLSAVAQDTNLVEDYFKRNTLKLKTPAITLPEIADPSQVPATLPMGLQYSHTLSSGQKVYTLPQDLMPCVVPDLNQFNMPNAGTGIQMKKSGAGVIPNPGHKAITVTPRGKTTLMKKP